MISEYFGAVHTAKGDNSELIRLQYTGEGAAHNKTFKTGWDLVSKCRVSIETVAMAERNLTSLGTNINSLATQLMVMMPTAERTSSEASRSMIQDESWDAQKEGVINGGSD